MEEEIIKILTKYHHFSEKKVLFWISTILEYSCKYQLMLQLGNMQPTRNNSSPWRSQWN